MAKLITSNYDKTKKLTLYRKKSNSIQTKPKNLKVAELRKKNIFWQNLIAQIDTKLKKIRCDQNK